MSAASQLVEISEVRAQLSSATVATYCPFPEFAENGRGVVIETIPKSPLHASIAKPLFDGLHTVRHGGLF